ncbi:MAG: DNA helicase II, partial [Rhodospirillales bacterium]|nr:DNA helicase II [Rhodospirillales bacterium]
IYGWRGAEVGNILRFEQDFPGAQVVRLERNYRSTGHILAAASGLIAHNAGRLGKTLWTEGEDGEKVRISESWDGDEEARAVGDAIEALHRDGESLDGIAILVRAGFQTRAFEERFLAISLPYRVIGGLRFYERQEIRDAVAYVRVMVRPDDDLAFERMVNLPKRGLGEVSLRPVHALARADGLSLYRAAERLIETDELRPRARSELTGLIGQLRGWRAALAATPHAEVVGSMLDESGYTEMWQKDHSPAAPGRLENLKELVDALSEFEDLEAFLDHVSLVMDREGDGAEEMVNIMTLHGAKGLEFDTVFLPGWEEGLFPHQLALDEAGAARLEEERRLAYVGLTRARRRAHVLFAANRHRHGQWVSAIPSRFVAELAQDHVMLAEETGMQPAPGGLYRGHGGMGSARRLMSEHAGYRSRRTPPVIDAVPVAAAGGAAAGGYTAGELIFHQKFGYGRIRSVDGDKLEIEFDKAGTKKVIDRFVQPADSV